MSDRQENFLVNFFLGGLSATISKTAAAPIERVKLILQTQDSNEKIIKSGKRYTGIGNCFSWVVWEEGAKELWRGNMANIVRYFPTQALNFAFKDYYKTLLPKTDKNTSAGKFALYNILSGGMAGGSSLLVVYPLDFARTWLGADIGKGVAEWQFTGILDVISKVSRTDGIKGLYWGMFVSVIGIIPYWAAYFGLFDTGKKYIPLVKDNLLVKFLFAQTVTSVAGLASYPFDTVWRRMMMQSGKKGMDV